MNLKTIFPILLCLLIVPLFVSGAEKSNSTKALKTKNKKGTLLKDECEKLLQESGDMVKPVLLIDGKSFPVTTAEIDSHCALGQKLYGIMNSYKPCISGLGRQALIILNKGIRKFIRAICSSKSKKERTIIDLKCASPETLPQWSRCVKIVDKQLNYVAYNSTDEGLLGDMCCLYNDAVECIRKGTGTTDGCHPKANTTKFFMNGLNVVLKEVLDFVCGKYQHKEDCERENPQGVQNLRRIAAEQTSVIEEKPFLIPPVLRAVGRLASDEDEETSS